MRKLIILSILSLIVLAGCKKESITENSYQELKSMQYLKEDGNKKGWFGRLLDKLKGVLPKIEIKFGVNTVVFDSQGNPSILPCVFSGICQILAGNSSSGNGGTVDAEGHLLMHEGDLVLVIDKNTVNQSEYLSHFGNGTLIVGDDIVVDQSICSLLGLPSGTTIYSGSYFVSYENVDYIVVKL